MFAAVVAVVILLREVLLPFVTGMVLHTQAGAVSCHR